MEESLRLERRFPTAAVFMMLLTLILIGIFPFFPEPHSLIAAILPAMLALWFWATRPSEQTLVFRPEHVSNELEDFQIRYDDIMGITLAGKTPAMENLPVSGGTFSIVDRSGTNHRFFGLSRHAAQNFYKKLLNSIPDSGSREVPSQLNQRLQNDLSLFDEDLIFTYRARPFTNPVSSQLRSICAILFLAAIVWIVIGASDNRFVFWLAAGIISAVTATVLFFVSFIHTETRNHAIPDWTSSGLMISPRGIAMKQGKLIGELKWSEIKAIHCGRVPRGQFATAHLPRTITLRIDGGQILIHDLYDRPLATIHRVIQRFWEIG